MAQPVSTAAKPPAPGPAREPVPVHAAAPAEPQSEIKAAAKAAPPRAARTLPASPLNPAPEEFPKAEPVPSSSQLDALLSRVAALRGRIAALGATLFSSKLRIELRSQGDAVRLKAVSVTLDGGVIFSAPAQAFFERAEVIYEHAVAPGPHVVGVEVERHDLTHPQFSTWQLSRFVVLVPEKKLLQTRLELEDDSSMGQEFPEGEAGHYDLQVRLEAEVSE